MTTTEDPQAGPNRFLGLPHHDPSERYVSNPSPSPGDTVTVEIDVPERSGFDQVMLRTMHDGEGRWHEGTSAAGPGGRGRRWRFELPCHNELVPYRFWCDGAPGPHWLTGLGLLDHDPTDHHDFRLTTTGPIPDWVPETVWYQIFPDRFASADPDKALPDWAVPARWDDPVAEGPEAMTQLYGGDLDGIAARLDHIVDLGIGGIYLNPVFPARSNHRYDAAAFDRVDPLLGGDAALVRLREACDRAGLRLITDLTLNHTGDGHDWFRTAAADAESVEAGFYYWKDHPDDYESWLGVMTLPKLDHSSAELRRRFYDGPDSALARYLEPPFSMDGWRIDVANMTGRLGLIDHNRMVRAAARATVDAVDRSRWMVGEHFFDATADVTGPGWHGVMNYAGVARPVCSGVGNFATLAAMAAGPGQDPRDGEAMGRAMDQVRGALPWQFVLGSMALLGSHDTARWRSMARSDGMAKVGVGLVLTLPGSPSIFYGDEIGLTGEDAEQARTPMPWDDRSRWDVGFLDWYRTLIRLRRSSSALARGGFRWVHRSADGLAFLRESLDQRLLVHATRAPTGPMTIDIADLGVDEIELVGGSGRCDRRDDRLVFDGDGPAFAVWRLG
ncbi:MAG: glycoside hydrolase family 13 protein [Actinomycetota bacterium]